MGNYGFLGAVVGDIVGSVYEFHNIRRKDFNLFQDNMFFTDDTVMTFAVMDALLNHKDPAKTMQEWGKRYPGRGYGGMFLTWLHEEHPEPYHSFGNGAAMRISPVGWISKNEEEVLKLSHEMTEVSHDHPEGLKGAYVTAMLVYMARQGKTKEELKEFASRYYDIHFDYEDLKKNYSFDETCQKTVPQAIYCFLISTDFIDCIRTSISIGGDSDTLSAISCAIAGAYYGIPQDIMAKTEKYLTPEMKELCREFQKKIDPLQ